MKNKLQFFNILKSEFDALCEPFTNRAIFEIKDGEFVRDIDGSLVLTCSIILSKSACID